MTEYKLIRGGSWYGAASNVRVSARFLHEPDSRYGLLGFRICVRMVPQ